MSDQIIRVFVRRTKWTPDDALTWVGEPPLPGILPEKLPVRISVVFSWDVSRAVDLLKVWEKRYHDVRIGGPAYSSPCPDFVPGRYIKHGVTFTSRGCPKRCPWCLVHWGEGPLRELDPIMPGHIVQDNNLFACSREHFLRVCDMLRTQRAIQFKGGIDIDYLTAWHVDQMKSLRIDELWVACDRDQDLVRLDKAADLLADWPQEKKRCYALGGFEGDTPAAAHRRCEMIYEKGFLPFAQYYKPPEAERWLPWGEWSAWGRKWARPAAYRKAANERRVTNDERR